MCANTVSSIQQFMSMLKILATTLLGFLPMTALADTYLLMAEETGCAWCERWNREIAEIYPKTPEGRAAPLRRFDKSDGAPVEISLARPVAFTPTFILINNDVEMGRIEGYPGEDFFWGLLGMMLDRAGIAMESTDNAG